MLEYSLEDAEKLLTSNMATAKKNLACVEHDLDFLRYVNIDACKTPFNINSSHLFVSIIKVTHSSVKLY